MIEVRDVHKELGEFSLRGVNLKVETGEYFVVLGPTGAGKTVLLECIAGLHKLDSGQVWLEGRDVTRLQPELRNVAYVPQDYVLFPHMSLRDNIAFSLVVRGAERDLIERRVAELSQMLGISHLLDRRPRTLSGGECQRGALARALAPSPTLLLLDEPLSALDEGTRAELTRELDTIARETKVTVIHVCHNFDEALELGDRIAVLNQGQIAQVGAPNEIFRKPASEFLARFVGARNVFQVQASDAMSGTVELVGGLKLRAGSVPEGSGLLAMVRPEEIAVALADQREPAAMSGTNRVRCLLERADDRGRFFRLILRGPVELTATMTRQAFAATGAREGDQVLATFAADAVHVIADSQATQG